MDFEFDLENPIESLDAVPEMAVEFFDKTESGYIIKDGLKQMAGAYNGVMRNLRTSRKAEREAKKKNSEGWLEVGESPEAIREKYDNYESQIEELSKGRVNLEKMRKDMEDAKQKAISKVEEDKNNMERSLTKHMIGEQAAKALAENKGSIDLLLPHVVEHARLFNEDGNYEVRIVDSAGDPRGNGQGGFMGISDLVKEMKQNTVFGRAFDADDRSGAGVNPNSATRRVSGVGNENKSSIQKVKDGLSNRF